MRNLIFVVENAIYENDGYKARIEMEMTLLKKDFNFYIIVPKDKRELVFTNKVRVVVYDAFSKEVPFLMNYFSLNKCLKKLIKEIESPIIIGEALPSAVAVNRICNRNSIPYVYDCHGTAPDEAYLYHKNIIGYLYKEWLRDKEKQIIDNCSLIITVSEKQYELFRTKKKHILMPMIPSKFFFDESFYRKQIRYELGIPADSNVYVYSGQNQKWQMSEETVRYFNRIKEKDKKAFLVIYTSQVEDFKTICEANNTIDYVVKKIDYKEMPKYLDVGDYGFCLRENHIINLVASPTKVLEYLSRGVTPIITEYVGDFSSLLPPKNLAIVVKELNNLEVGKFHKIIRKEANEFLLDFSNQAENDYVEAMVNI